MTIPRTNPILLAAMAAYNIPFPWEASSQVLKGPFLGRFTYTDNTALDQSLLDGNAFTKDQRFSQYFGTSANPDVIMVITGARLVLTENGDTAAALGTLRDEFYLEHTQGENTRRENLWEGFEVWPGAVSQGGTEAVPSGVKVRYGVEAGEPFTFDAPLLVNFRVDTFKIKCAAVDVVGNIPCKLLLYGMAWNGQRLGPMEPIPFPKAPMDGVALREFKTEGQDSSRNLRLPGARTFGNIGRVLFGQMRPR